MSGLQYWYQTGNGTGFSNEQIEESYKRDSTLQWKASRIGQIADAYKSPEAFYRKKAVAVEEAADKAAKVYREAFRKLINEKVPGSLATTRAQKMASAYEALLLAEVESDYPSNLSDLSLQLTYNKGSAQESGFATPSTKIGGGGKKTRKARK